jgi:hypothetical protein
VKERDHLRGENQALQGRLFQLAMSAEDAGKQTAIRKAEVGVLRAFTFFMPNIVLVEGTAGFLVMELDHLNRALATLRQLNDAPGTVHGTRITNGWQEHKFFKGSLFKIRLYLRHNDGTGKYEVLLSRKQLQERDFEKLARMLCPRTIFNPPSRPPVTQ